MAVDNPFQSPTTNGSASITSTRRPWLRRSLAVGAIGLVIAFLGLVYGAVMVGVPYQDPTPEMARREAFHIAVSGSIMAVGCCVTLLAMLGFLSVLVARGITRLAM